MGPFVPVWRLATHDLRHRLTQSVLLLVVIAAATSTLALAFALDGTSNTPWRITRAATAGPDVIAEAYSAKHPALGELTALTRAGGVVATSGPYPMASPVLRTGKIADPVFAEGRDETMPAIDRPYLTAGTWVRPSGMVIERGFAGQLTERGALGRIELGHDVRTSGGGAGGAPRSVEGAVEGERESQGTGGGSDDQ